ncbi:hypothetical protein DYQ86_26275 [Acidobacteria bacterium AB60]|nr:hypothetical protein DYQ86_26275 [Acidobacteria bacterium AB60]
MTAVVSNGSADDADARRDVAASLGRADRDREVAQNTRRVVMASLGVIRDQKAVRKRTLSLALAAILGVLLVLGPLAWLAVDHFFSGGHLGDLTTQFSLWVCILCPAILAAALVAGKLRKR